MGIKWKWQILNGWPDPQKIQPGWKSSRAGRKMESSQGFKGNGFRGAGLKDPALAYDPFGTVLAGNVSASWVSLYQLYPRNLL